MPQSADRNLLFGVLALQMDFIKQEHLIAAMQRWVFDKSKSLGEILVAQGALHADNHALVEALTDKDGAVDDHDPVHKPDPFDTVGPVPDLNRSPAPTPQQSLTQVSQAPNLAQDIFATIAPGDANDTRTGDARLPADSSHNGAGCRYRILRPHAKGGLGEVFVAQDQELHREVALKEIQERAADNPESRSRFIVEAEITGGLEHPGIVPVYGLGTYADGRPYYAMRFIRGDSLKEAIDHFHKADKAGMDAGQRTLELRGLLGRFVDVCNAMAYAHSRCVLHRDLKPGNIMLGKYGETLVVDWGLAKPMGAPGEKKPSLAPIEDSLVPHSSSGSQTMMGSAVGTPQYMSPEQAAGKHDQLGPASDVYSLGATLYCVLTGLPPFMDRDAFTVINKVMRGEFPKPRAVKASVPAALDAVCCKAMALKPEDRYASPAELSVDIEHWLADEPVSAWVEPFSVRARRWISRHTALVTGVASAVAIALVSLIAATVLLTAANEREREAKSKAEANFALARGAVDTYLTNVSEEALLQEPGMQPLRKRLLESARKFNEEFRKERAGDASVQTELAKATYRLAQIVGDIESEPAAISLHEEAVQLFEALPADKINADTQSDLAACYHHLGRLNRLTDKMAKSEESYKKALALWEQLVQDQPKENRYRDGLARSQLGLGNLCQLLRRRPEAQESYERSLANWEALHQIDRTNAGYRRDLATSRNNLGLLYKYTPGKQVDAKKLFDDALALQTRLVEEAPNIGQYQVDLARTQLNLGNNDEAVKLWQGLIARNPAVTEPHKTLADAYIALAPIELAGDPKKAKEDAHKALTILRNLADAHPGMTSYQGDLARGWMIVGEVCKSIGQVDEATLALHEAIRIQDKLVKDIADVPNYRRDLARSYINLGQILTANKDLAKADDAFRNALGLWEKLIKDHGRDVDYLVGEALTCYGLGELAVARSKYQDAIIWHTRALEAAPEGLKPMIKKRLDQLRAI